MFEIYYTSAPSGLKRGTSGFSTVAATEGIPKALLERLESLSAYRHHFAQGATSVNPVSYAHWKLSATGKDYHVLSRVCDSGVDHTHRTNAFAHHVALDTHELSAAGPAAMLASPGVMLSTWDGNVGNLSRAAVSAPQDVYARPCSAWQTMAGDAGYAGLLLEAAIKSPTKPVTLLFSPGQDILPLMAEVLALLPAPIRWAVTFNTYFTSMPTSAVCAWRCCIAKTPAADAALRATAGGLIIDLTDRAKLPALPGNAYVAAARNGTPLTPAAPAARSQVKRQIPPKLPGKAAAPAPVPVVDDNEDLQAEIELAVRKYGTALPPPPPPSPGLPLPSPEELPQLDLREARASQSASPSHAMPLSPAGIIDDHDEQLRRAEAHAVCARKRRQTNLLFLYVLAVMAIGLASIILLYALSAPPPPPQIQPTTRTASTTRSVSTAPVAVDTQPATTPVALTAPATIRVETQAGVTQPAVTAPKAARTIVLRQALDSPTARNALNDKRQSIPLTAEDAADLKGASSLVLILPYERDDASSPVTLKIESRDTNGVFTLVSTGSSSSPGLTIRWKSTADLAPSDVVTLSYDRRGNKLDVVWKSALALRQPDAVLTAYWVLTHSTLLAVDASGNRSKAQKIRFSPPAAPVFYLAEGKSPLKLPADVPPGTVPTVASELPQGWIASVFTDWETKDATQRSPDNMIHTISLKKRTTSAAIDAWFTVTFRPHYAAIETNLAQRVAKDESDMNAAEVELRGAQQEIARITDNASYELNNLEAAMKELQDKLAKPKAEGYSKEALTLAIGQKRSALDSRRARLEEDLRPHVTRRDTLEATIAAHRAAIGFCREIESFDVVLKLPNDLPATTIHIARNKDVVPPRKGD